MSAALIAMTILGCNDAVTSCRYVATVDKKWETVADCNTASEKRVQLYTNANYPTVIAVCEKPQSEEARPTVAATPPVDQAKPPQETVQSPGFAARIAAEVRAHLPSGNAMTTVIAKPVHYVTDGYAWMVRQF